MSTLYGCSVTFIMSLDFKGYSEKNYDVTCTVLFQGNLQDPDPIYTSSSFLSNLKPEIAHVARDVFGQLMKMLIGDEEIDDVEYISSITLSPEARTVK